MDNVALTLKEIQDVSFEVLKKIKNICEKENIKYFLFYGTLLGAIRHKGYIPWDDDVDIMMPREDFEKFKKYCLTHEEEIKPLKFCSRETVANYEYYIPRISDTRYKYVTTMKNQRDFELGIFVDIYPFDYCGDTLEQAIKMKKHIYNMNLKFGAYLNGRSYDKWYLTLIKYPLHIYMRLLKGNNYSQRINNEIDKYILTNGSKNDKNIGEIGWDGLDHVIFNKELFDSVTKVKFHNDYFDAPSKYDEILKKLYGDYMQLPPEDQRKPQHFYQIYKIKD